MQIFGKVLTHLTADDIERLVNEQVPESKSLEYKVQLPGQADENKREFLADVSSFANTAGGLIVFGIEEEVDAKGRRLGTPKSIVGLEDFVADREILRLESIIRSGLAPVLKAYAFRAIRVADANMLALGIGRSIFAPHMITFKNDSRFWTRGNSGKQQMSVDELRSAFSQMSDWENDAREFRSNRLRAFPQEREQMSLLARFPMLLHVVPLGRRGNLIPLQSMPDTIRGVFRATSQMGSDGIFDLDGYVALDTDARQYSYLRIFRFGAIEYCIGGMFEHGNTPNVINAFWFEHRLFEVFPLLTEILEKVEILPPLSVMVTLMDTKGLKFLQPDGEYRQMDEMRAIHLDQLVIPDVVLDGSVDNEIALKPILDMVWQSAGWAECPGFARRMAKRIEEREAKRR